MKPAPFDLHRPREIDEALSLLARHGDDAKLIAGGQSLVPLMNLRMAAPAVLVDLGRVAGLRSVTLGDDAVVIGAMTRQADLLVDPIVAQHAPLLRGAARHIGHVQTRARGTVGGSVAHADPAAELPCALVALDATFTIRGGRGTRIVAARSFFHGALTTDLGADEILCSIAVPRAAPGTRAAFREVARRHGDFALAAVAVQRDGRNGRVSACLGGVLPAPHLCASLGEELQGGDDRAPRRAAAIARAIGTLDPMSDIFASGSYRARLATVLLSDALDEVMADG